MTGFVATGRAEASERRKKDISKTAITQLEQMAQAARSASTLSATSSRAGADPLHLVLDAQLKSATATLQTLAEA